MQDDNLFEDGSKVQIITPYRKLRLLRGWSLEQAAEEFLISRRTLIDVELGRKDAPKWLIRKMDSVYGCGGQLISYWLPKFSYSEYKPPPSIWERIRRWIYGTVD